MNETGLDYLWNASVDFLDYLRNPSQAKGRRYKWEKESEERLPGLMLQPS
jgi:hypothetical protein